MAAYLPTRPTRARLAPFGDFERMETRLRRLMEETFGETEEMGWMPATDVVERDGEFAVTLELPGLSREDIEIDVEGDVLRIHGEKREERKEEKEEKGGTVRISERRYGSFSRSFTLPASVEAEKISAEMTDGVLKLHLPKTEVSRGRKIEIEKK